MAKTYRTIQQWDRWLGQFPGLCTLNAEKKMLPPLLSHFYGKHALLIGTPRQSALLKTVGIPNQMLLSPLSQRISHNDIHVIESEFYELPIAPGSIDLVMLPHTLEYLDNPHHLLTEACRIVRPEGHIIITGFNPYSLWGLKKLITHTKNIPWSENFIHPHLIKKWLELADFQIKSQSFTLYRPPVSHEKTFEKLHFLEWLGRKCFKPFGGIYTLVAQAKVIPLTSIKLRWKQQLSGVQVPMGMPGPSIRNRPE